LSSHEETIANYTTAKKTAIYFQPLVPFGTTGQTVSNVMWGSSDMSFYGQLTVFEVSKTIQTQEGQNQMLLKYTLEYVTIGNIAIT
jgi:hypothetical protein